MPGESTDPQAVRLHKLADLMIAAHSMLGTPYVWGGNVPGKALDCSGFVQQSYLRIGIKLPRVTFDQVHAGHEIQVSELERGDLIFTEPGRNGPNHVGMYVGMGRVQESPHHGDVNKTLAVNAFIRGGFVSARRIVT